MLFTHYIFFTFIFSFSCKETKFYRKTYLTFFIRECNRGFDILHLKLDVGLDIIFLMPSLNQRKGCNNKFLVRKLIQQANFPKAKLSACENCRGSLLTHYLQASAGKFTEIMSKIIAY